MREMILSFLIYSISGVLLHFLYDFSKKNKIVGLFASVNESEWEHIKLLLTPIFFFNTIKNILQKSNNFYFTLLIELLLAIALIIIFSRLKQLIFKDKYDFFNIIFFFITAFIISFVSYYIKGVNIPNIFNTISAVFVLVIFILYLSLTIFPPKNKLFKDPQTGTYGFNIVK